jgi:HAD superfamily hydrolase (TIGR01509 family)
VSALLFDCDGVLADTERYGHLPAFNRTFADFGVPAAWTEEEYAEKLKIGGGKERMASLFDDPNFVAAADIPEDDRGRGALLAQWHKAKTAHFKQFVAEGRIPPRPGIGRIIPAALDAGWTVAVCSTSAPESVGAVLRRAVGEAVASRVPVFAGDVVPAKKPDPGIYLLAIDKLGLRPAETLVVEDSRNGLLAAVGAGLRCVVTVNGYTRNETFEEASLVVSELGDPGSAPITVLSNRSSADPHGYVTLDDLRAVLATGSVPTDPPASPAARAKNPLEGEAPG